MIIIPEKIRSYFHVHYLQRENEFKHIKRNSIKWERANTLGIIFNASKLENHIHITQFAEKLRKEGKHVKLMGYVDVNRSSESFLHFPVFTKEDLNWHLKPIGGKIVDFIEQPLDILFNAYRDNSLPLEYVSRASKAQCRVGPYRDDTTDCSDLMLRIHEGSSIDAFLNDMYNLLLKLQTP